MKKFSQFIATALATVSVGAFALPPTVAPELEVTLSGASAQDNGILELVSGLCNAGTLDRYSDSGATAIGNYNGYYCAISLANLTDRDADGSFAALDVRNTAGAAGADGNLNVLIYKRSAGGSGEGPNGLCAQAINQVLVNNTCVDNGTGGDPIAGDRIYRCPSLAPRFSDGGISDLEFKRLPAPFGSACNGYPVVDNAIYGTIFNTPVSLNLRNALQCAQGLQVGAEDEANMPSLPKAVVHSIFAGGIANWNAVRAQDAFGAYVTLAQAVTSRVSAGMCPGYNAATFPVPTDTRIRACRRVASSGTNTQFRVKFMNATCVAGVQDQLSDNTPFSTVNTNTNANWQNTNPVIASAPAVIENSSSGNVSSCLNAFADIANPATQRWAIGIQSTENNVSLSSNYRFIKIDGSAPTVEQVLNNNYFDWVESVWSWLATGDENKIDLQAQLLAGTGSAGAVAALVSNFTHAFGASGVVALNTIPGNTVSIPASALNPVATSTHAAGGNLDSCRTPFVNRNFVLER